MGVGRVHLGGHPQREAELPALRQQVHGVVRPGVAGYYFDPAADGSTDPSGPAYEIFNNIPGTGLDNAMPWSGETYTLQPWVPVREPPHR